MSETRDLGKVIEHRIELLQEYDVTDKRYCINEKPRKIKDVFKDVVDRMNKEYPNLMKKADYFDFASDVWGHEESPWPDHGWLIVHYVQGASEGYYIHVAANIKGKYSLIFLGKTLREGEAGIAWAEQMVAALSRIMKV